MNLICGLLAGALLSAGLNVTEVKETGKNNDAGQTAVTTQLDRQPLSDVSGDRKPANSVTPILLTEAVQSDAKSDVKKKAVAKDTAEEPKPKKRKPLKRRVLVVKATWCGACQALRHEWPKLRKVRWRIGERDSDHFQLIDSDEHPEIVQKYRVTSLPTLILVEDGRELGRHGFLNAKNMAEFYSGRLE